MKSNSFIAILCGLGALTLVAFVDYQQYNFTNIQEENAVVQANSLFFDNGEAIFVKNPETGVSPANILYFEAERVGTGVLLLWDATDELELVGYQVEKSIGNEPYKRIGWVYSKEISREPNYEFMDTRTTLESPCFYRLKMVDFDGKESYSPVISTPVINY